MRVSFPHTLESKAERNSTHENRVSDFQREASSTTLGSEINKQKMRTGARVQKGGKEYNVGIIEAQTQTRRRRRRRRRSRLKQSLRTQVFYMLMLV